MVQSLKGISYRTLTRDACVSPLSRENTSAVSTGDVSQGVLKPYPSDVCYCILYEQYQLKQGHGLAFHVWMGW